MPRTLRDVWRGPKRGGRGGVALVVMLAVAGGAVGVSAGADAQPVGAERAPRAEPTAAPTLAKAVSRLLEAEYLGEEERKDLRIWHGVWREADLDTPARAAAASLMAGDLDNIALTMESVSALDRAEAAEGRGEYREALAILDAAPEEATGMGLRAERVRADALMALGRAEEAAGVADVATQRFARSTAREPGDVVEAVRLFELLTRLRGPALAGTGGEYHAMMRALDQVRNQVDKLHWPTRLAQAELLYAKDNAPEAAMALQEVLALNPSCAKAWAILGQMSVDAFNFGMAEGIAARLDLLASGRGGAGVEGAAAREGSGGVSIDAAIIRAHAAIRQGDPEGAAMALAPALARAPGERRLLAAACGVEALRYDDAALERALAEFDRLAPGSPLAYYEVGKAFSEARQYAPAAGHLEVARDRQPFWAEPVIELGLLEVQSGRLDRALAALTTAMELDPFNARADNSLRLVKELETYDVVESEHFVVRFKPGVDGVLAREMLAPMERNYAIVTGPQAGGIDYEPAVKTTIDLMPDHKWFGVRIAGMPAIHTIAASTGSCIAMEAPREGRDHLGTYDWVRVLRHEFVHTVTLARTNNRIPHWFTEASAVYLELSPREYNTCKLLAGALGAGALFDLNQINIAFVRPARPTDRQQAYAQGHWMYEYIIEQWGARAPLDLMDLYAKGQREEAAFESVLGVSREEFLRRFTVWAREQVVSWGLALAEGVPSVVELLVEEATTDPARADEIRVMLGGLAEEAGMLALGVGGTGDEHAWDISLPDPTPEMIDRWLAEYPAHPDVLELAVQEAMKGAGAGWSRGGGQAVTLADAPLLERYAAARPVDPTPHRLLANLYLNGPDGMPGKAIAHLEYLDAREQHKAVYAAELTKRYVAEEEWGSAWEKAERATQVSPYDAGLREMAATVALKRGDLAGAERHIAALVELEPGVLKHVERLGAIKRMRGAGTP